MAKFKTGDRVRVLSPDWADESAGISVGQTGVVVEDNSEVPYVLFDHSNKRRAMDEDQLELIPDPEVHVFSSGDRFRFIRDNSDGGAEYGQQGDEFVIHHVSDERISFIDPKRSWKVGAYIKDIEPATGDAPVKPAKKPKPNLKANFSIPREILTKAAETYVKEVYGITLASAKLPYGTALVPLHAKVSPA